MEGKRGEEVLQRDGVEQAKAGGVGTIGHCEESSGLLEEQREAAVALSSASLVLAVYGWAPGSWYWQPHGSLLPNPPPPLPPPPRTRPWLCSGASRAPTKTEPMYSSAPSIPTSEHPNLLSTPTSCPKEGMGPTPTPPPNAPLTVKALEAHIPKRKRTTLRKGAMLS